MNYTVNIDLPMSKRIEFINEVSGMTVSQELGYITLLEEMMYQYCLIKYCTDIEIFETGFNIDELENFLKENQNIIEEVTAAVDKDKTLRNACKQAVIFRRDNYMNSIDELLSSISNWINTSLNKDIDMNLIQSLSGLMSTIKDMDAPDVAKAIIESNTVIPFDKK